MGKATQSRDTYLRLVQRLDPETAVKAALWLLDGTSLPGLRSLSRVQPAAFHALLLRQPWILAPSLP